MWWPIDLNAMLLSFLSGQITKSVPPGLDEARRAVLAMIEQVQRDTNLPLSRFILAGFSQGAMLATDVALHLPESPAALAIFSVRMSSHARTRRTHRARTALMHDTIPQGVLICEDEWKPLMSKRQGMKVPTAPLAKACGCGRAC
jgi:pimeloyl-ACP methyl ester carboxylesterase